MTSSFHHLSGPQACWRAAATREYGCDCEFAPQMLRFEIGSCKPPNTTTMSPSRSATMAFTDADKAEHLRFSYAVDIKKDWAQ